MKVFLLAVILAAVAPTGSGQKRDDLIGTWKLVSAWSTKANGERVPLYGEHPIGFLTYMSDGRMTAIIGDSKRPPLSTEDRIAAPMAERAAAFSTLVSYAGTFRVEKDRVIHRVEISSLQNWVGTDQVRQMKFDGRQLTLRPPVRILGGERRTNELVWERLR